LRTKNKRAVIYHLFDIIKNNQKVKQLNFLIMKKLILLLIFITTIFTSTFAQAILSGIVSDESKAPIEGAQVILSISGQINLFATTDKNGHYEIRNVTSGKYNIDISCVGYMSHTLDIDIKSSMTMDVSLKEDTIQLDAVVINGNRRRKDTATGHRYYLSESARDCGNPFKALQEIPEVISDYVMQSVSSVDNKQMLVLIDGMQVNTGIAPIDPKRIESIDISDVVSAKYIRSGAQKIMNIHLKHQKEVYKFFEYGFRNDVPIYYSSTWIKMEIGNEKISFYFDFIPNQNHNQKAEGSSMSKGLNYRKFTDDKSKKWGFGASYTLMLKYMPTLTDYFAAYFECDYSKLKNRTNSSGTFMAANTHNDMLNSDSIFSSDYNSSNTSRIYSGTLYHKHKINNKMDIETHVRGSWNHNILKDNTNEYYPSNTWNYRNDFRTNSDTYSFDFDYSWNISNNISLFAGNSLSYKHDRLSEIINEKPIFLHKMLNEYLYLDLDGSLKHYKYSISYGADLIWRTSAGVKDHYYRPRANMSLTRDLKSAGSVTLDYFITSAAPPISLLNPYNTSTDSLTKSVGNPHLKPQQTQSVSLSYSNYMKGLYFSLFSGFTYINDRYEVTGYTDGNGIYTKTYETLGHYKNLDFSAMLQYNYKFLTVGTYVEHFVNYFTGQSAKKSFTCSAYYMQSFKKWGLSMNINYTNYEYTPISRTHMLVPKSSRIRISYNFTPNIMLALGTYAFAGEEKAKTFIYTKGYESVTTNKKFDFHPFILFRLSFRKNRNKKIGIENDIIKPMDEKIDLLNK
jgi:hypothetical protein